MTTNHGLHRAVVASLGIVALLLAAPSGGQAQQAPPVSISPDDLGGTVSDATGPEAGVWVIAETHDLPTRYIKIVVTDDEGRFVILDLPKANYDLWMRGYGPMDLSIRRSCAPPPASSSTSGASLPDAVQTAPCRGKAS